MEQPPTESKVPPVGLKIIAQRLRKVVIIVVLKTDRRCIRRRRGQRNHARQVVPTAQQVELDPSKDGQKRQGVNESKGSGNSW